MQLEGFLTNMTDKEFLRAAYAAQDPITTTVWEKEMYKRLERVLEEYSRDILKIATERNVIAADLQTWVNAGDGDHLKSARLVEALYKADMTSEKELAKMIDFQRQFFVLNPDADDFTKKCLSLYDAFN